MAKPAGRSIPQPATTPQPLVGTPAAYPVSSYDFTLQAVIEMQKTVGQLAEAVNSLKDQSKAHDDKLDAIGKDVHAAKVVLSVVGGGIVVFAGFIAWLVNTYISTHPAK